MKIKLDLDIDKVAQAIIDDIEKLIKSGEVIEYKPSAIDNKIKDIFESLPSFEDSSDVTVPPKNPDEIKYFESNPKLIAVVETINYSIPTFVTESSKSQPSHIQLLGGASNLEVAYLIAKLYTVAERFAAVRGTVAPDSIKALCAEFPASLNGGLAAIDGNIIIMPSCCCRLEHWPEWRQLLDTGEQPWLGHGPSPWVEVQDNKFLVWPNGGMGEEMDASLKPARFNRTQLKVVLASVQQDIRDFLFPLRRWALHYCLEDTDLLVACFAKAFANFESDRDS